MTDHHCADTPFDHLKFHRSEIADRICGMVHAVERDNAAIGLLGTGERCAVALLDRPDLAKKAYGTLLECAIRVGQEWLAAALYVQSNGWTEPAELHLA